MKNTTTSKIIAGLIAVTLSTAAFAQAQNQNNRGPRGDRPEGGPRGGNPIIGLIDANHDRVFSADEIANASKALASLDANGDGSVTQDEVRAFAEANRPEEGQGRGPRADAGDEDQGRPERRMDRRGGPDGQGQSGPNDRQGPQGDNNGPRGERPQGGGLLGQLDANHDHVLSADEIAKASDVILSLDKNGDGQVTPDELRPNRPEGQQGEGRRERRGQDQE